MQQDTPEINQSKAKRLKRMLSNIEQDSPDIVVAVTYKNGSCMVAIGGEIKSELLVIGMLERAKAAILEEMN